MDGAGVRARIGAYARNISGAKGKTDRKESGRTTGECSAEGRPQPMVEGGQSLDSILGQNVEKAWR